MGVHFDPAGGLLLTLLEFDLLPYTFPHGNDRLHGETDVSFNCVLS